LGESNGAACELKGYLRLSLVSHCPLSGFLVQRKSEFQSHHVVEYFVGSREEDQGLDPIIRQSCITLIILVELLQLKLIAFKPLEIAEFGKIVSQACLAATNACVQSTSQARGNQEINV
jgi:hypothetical protein